MIIDIIRVSYKFENKTGYFTSLFLSLKANIVISKTKIRKQITVTIPDNKESLFMELMKNLSFVTKAEPVENLDIPEWHKAIIDERLAKYKANPEEVLDFDQAMDDIEKEL